MNVRAKPNMLYMLHHTLHGAVLNAVQWNKLGDHPMVTKTEYPNRGEIINYLGVSCPVMKGDWIITDKEGKFHVRASGTFENEFEPV